MDELKQAFYLNADIDDFFDEKYKLFLETEFKEEFLSEDDFDELLYN